MNLSSTYASFYRFPRCRYATYFTCSFHLIQLRRARLALLSKTFSSREFRTIKMLMPLVSLKYKKFCMGLFSLGVLSERISNVEKMYRARPRGYFPIRVWFLYSTLELWSITHIYTRYSSAHVPRGAGGDTARTIVWGREARFPKPSPSL